MIKVEKIVAALGTEDFSGAMLEALHGLSWVDHYALIRFDGLQNARLVASASCQGFRIDPTVQEEYIGHFHRLDPNRALFAGAAESVPRVGRLQRHGVPDAGYRCQCYDRPGLVDRLSIVAAGSSAWYSLNLFRSRASREFSPGEEASIRGAAALLAALTIKHDAIVAPAPQVNLHDRLVQMGGRLRALAPHLAPREIAVAVRILAGLTSEGIAIDLGVSVNSVLTYRKRIYAKLGISSQNELFSLCLFGSGTYGH